MAADSANREPNLHCTPASSAALRRIVPTELTCIVEPGYAVERIVAGSGFHTANGVAFGPDGRLYVASVSGESIFALDIATGAITVEVGPFAGEADDLAFAPDGDLISTAFMEGIVRRHRRGGGAVDLATGLPGINSIAFTRDGKRLFVGQVLMGEGLWEIDLAGAAPPRLVTDHTGGLNAFTFGPDGMIYAPSWDRGQVVRVDPESGATTVLADGFHKPGAVRFDAADQLFALDDETGELWALDREGDGWRKRFITRHGTATDNMAMGADGLIYVSNMADNAIDAVDPRTGAVRTVVSGALAFPRAIAMATGPGGEEIHVADSGAYRIVDPRTGAVRDVARAVASPLQFPSSVSVGPTHVVLIGEGMGVVQLYDRKGNHVRDIARFDRPSAAIELADGGLLVAEPIAGRLLLVTGDERRTVVEHLDHPAALVDAGDGSVLVADSGSGKLLRVGLADGTVTTLAADLGGCRAIAVVGDGTAIILDATGGRLLSVDLVNGQATPIASGLPVGYLNRPYPRSGGVAVGSDGVIHLAADVENALYRLRPIHGRGV